MKPRESEDAQRLAGKFKKVFVVDDTTVYGKGVADVVRKELKAHGKLYPGAGENRVSWVHIDLEHHAWFNP